MPMQPRRDDHAQEGPHDSSLHLEGATTLDQTRSPGDVSRAAEVVRQWTVRVLSERIRLLGIDRSGAYEHYNQRLSTGFVIPSGDLVIVDLIKRRLPDLRSYHEIGSGLGTLPLILAYEGFVSVGIERDRARHLTATAILRELSSLLPDVERNCRLIGAAFPDAVADLDVSQSAAILTDFVSSQEAADYARMCRRLGQYRYVLLDLQRFCDKRDSKAEQERLVEELALYGLLSCGEEIDLGGEGCYQLFEGKASESQSDTVVAPREPVSEGLAANPLATVQPMQLPIMSTRSEVQAQQATEVAVREADRPPAPPGVVALPPMPQRARRKRFGGLVGISALLVIGIPTLLAVLYYGILASSQYVTSFQFAVRGPSQVNTGRSAGAAMMGPSAMSPDSFVVTDYINSSQATVDVGRSVDLRAIFLRPEIDFLSRPPSGFTPEELSAYWEKMVSAQFDLISGNISVSVRAFTPQDSLKLAQALVASSDEMFRVINTKAQQDFVRVADDNVDRAQQHLTKARQALFVFREESGLVDPDKTAQAGASIVDDLRKQLAALRTQYGSIKAAAPNSPMLTSLNSQIAALEEHIRKEDGSGSSKVKSVSAQTLAEYQSLELERQFADKQYVEALAMRNQAYLTAQNQQSYLALFVAPTLPQTSLYPNRLRSIAAVVLSAAAAWFVGVLIVFALRDHLM